MNILYLRQLLGIDWVPFGYSEGIATTAGALVFDVYQSMTDGAYYVKVRSWFRIWLRITIIRLIFLTVKVHYDAATPDQQRQATVLSVSNPPSVSEVLLYEYIYLTSCLKTNYSDLACDPSLRLVDVSLGNLQRSSALRY